MSIRGRFRRTGQRFGRASVGAALALAGLAACAVPADLHDESGQASSPVRIDRDNGSRERVPNSSHREQVLRRQTPNLAPYFAASRLQDCDDPLFGDSPSDQQALRELKDLRVTQLSYLEAGDSSAPLVVLFHGLPMSALEWGEVIPRLAERFHVIAFDQLSQGESSRHSTLGYTFKQHLAYFDAAMASLKLSRQKAFLVATDTGGPFAFAYATRHATSIAGLAFFETIAEPLPSLTAAPALFQFGRSDQGQTALIGTPMASELLANSSVPVPALGGAQFSARPIEPGLLVKLQAPLADGETRRGLARWFREVPITADGDGYGTDNLALFQRMRTYLATTTAPKLFLYAEPGFVGRASMEKLLEDSPNVTTASLGAGFHFLTQDRPERLAQQIRIWADSHEPEHARRSKTSAGRSSD